MGVWSGPLEGLEVKPGFWRGRRVLVTGHTGFKGSWLSLLLSRLGAEVTGYALAPSSKPNLFELASVATRMASIVGDIRDFGRFRRCITEAKPEIVFHLAAQAMVRAGYRDPLETFSTNVLGTAHVLEACRSSPGLRVIVNVTTDKCYENREWTWSYRENDRLGGSDPYAASKACAELVSTAYRESFFRSSGSDDAAGVGLATARAGNVIGGGDWGEDRLVPDLVRAACAGKAARVRLPDAVRPWQHVLDPLSGYLLLAERLWEEGDRFADAWNFGPRREDAHTVRWIAERFQALWADKFHWAQEKSDGQREAMFLTLDSSKARALLGWCPRLSADLALEWTVRWYREVRADEAAAAAVTFQQIDDYQGRHPLS